MTARRFKMVVVILVFALLVSIIPACQPVFAAESYLAVVPRVLHSGGSESISLALFKGDNLVPGEVEVTLLKEGQEVLKVKENIYGKGTIELDIPDIEEGDYEIRVKSNGFEDIASVKVEKSFLVFLETDKPIYKPGQTIHMRVFTLNPELRPESEPVTIEVLDAKGIKIFRSELSSDEYGMASLNLPLSQEPNLGVWKINAATDKAESQLDVRVEEYVLPKYEVKAELPREWFLVSETITGIVSVEYSFGKAVKGELEIIASKYVGEWEEYATFTADIDGQAEFELPAAGYVAGVPGAGGQGNVMLDITVREMSTGYEEKINKLLTIAETPHNLQIIAEGLAFKPGLPFSFLIISETPDNQPIDTEVAVTITYLDNEYREINSEEKEIDTTRGKAIVELTPPQDSVALIIEAFELTPESSAEPARASKVLQASYSPSGSFIHVEQISDGIPRTGEDVIFNVYSTRGRNFYYEVVSGGRVVFSDFTRSSRISFPVTPQMAPTSRLLVYQILPNSEVAADYIPFKVEAEYPHSIKVEFNQDEARPGDDININIETEGEARVGIVAVDKSVFILAENRLNLQQVFDELERLYMQPQVEIHEVSIYPAITTRGAQDVFTDAGVVVLSNNNVPQGKDYEWQGQKGFWDGVWQFLNGGIGILERDGLVVPEPAPMITVTQTTTAGQAAASSGLAEVERIRQFFPETWLWEEVTIGPSGQISIPVQVPDTITTWMLRAVAISKENGLGIAEDELRAFQPFFLKVDLPYSAIRGEEFPVKIAVYNYLDQPQSVLVQIEEAGWFELLDETQKTVEIAAGDVGSAQFNIRLKGLGFNDIKLTAQSTEAADAVVKTLLVQPEGVPREFVDNLILSEGSTRTVDTSIPDFAIPDSGRVYIAVTSSYLTQTIDGLEELIQMPFGCGEQNMLLFAPDVFITRYLEESGQLKPEIMAKAEKLIITGYQRELTYRRSDGSFSAFGESDDIGSLWLTAFVLKSFAQAEDIIYIDQSVLSGAAAWITSHQNTDGSFEAIGFVHHQEMMGGVSGKNALTAYVATALLEAGENAGAAKATSYLEKELGDMEDPYTVAITAYALELAGSERAEDAYQKLMALAEEDENGLHWGGGEIILPTYPKQHIQSASIEATAYATLALIKHGDAFNASRAAKWLVSQRNAYGGYGSTQDTVVALQALTEYSTDTRADVDLTVKITAPGFEKELKVTQENFDVLQIVAVPINQQIEITTTGQGEAIGQVVRRFNLPRAENEQQIMNITVDYDTTQVEVNDLVNISVSVEFNPPEPMEAGMVVLDISVPTGFAPITETLDRLLEQETRIKRYEIAGRKVIFYIENMFAGDKISFGFQVVALHPVKAKAVSSQAYSYYKPELKGETLGQEITVS